MTNFLELSLEKALQDDKLQNVAEIIAKDISTNADNLVIFMEKMDFALTSQSVELRVNGTQLLTQVLMCLPTDFLSEAQLEYLSQFYADRLKDHHNVIPAVIDGIEALVHKKMLSKHCITIMLQSFFQNTSCQSQKREDRAKLFRIFKYLTEEYLPVLEDMGGDFIYGLVNSIDGERDPRNLDFIFTFMPSVIARLPLLHLGEEMFEIFACYFPIDFTPSKNDPDFIKRDDLSAKLISCLVATQDFSEWTIELALDKLESDLILAKLDSLELLRQSAIHFSISSLEAHFEQIWQTLKTDLLPGNENEAVVRSSLQTLKCILERAREYPDISHNFQTIILGNILNHLGDVKQRLFNPATAIALVCIAGDPQFAADKILNTFLLRMRPNADAPGNPPGGHQTAEGLSIDLRTKVYHQLEQIYKIASISDSSLKHINSDISQEIQSEVIGTLKSGTSTATTTDVDDELLRAAFAVLNESTPILNEKNRALLYQILGQLTFHDTLDLDFTHLLEQLGALHPIELQSNFIDPCTRNFIVFSSFVKSKIYRNLLPLVKQIAFTERILHLIFTNIFDEGKASTDTVSNEVRETALDALQKMLLNEDSNFIENLQHNNDLIERLIRLAKNFQFSNGGHINSLQRVSAILSIIVQNLAVAEQYAIVTTYLPALDLQSAPDLFVAKGLLGYLHKDISLDSYFEALMGDLTKVSLQGNASELREIADRLACSTVNKIDTSNDCNRNVLSQTIKSLECRIQENTNEKAVQMLAWLAKGLAVRGCDETAGIIGTLAELLDHPLLSTTATSAFDIISADVSDLHLPNVKFLFKQKLFHIVLSKLKDKLESNSNQHLCAFIYVIRATPHGVLKMHIEKIGSIVFRSLDSQNVNILRIVLVVCKSFVEQQDDYFRSHLNHIIPSLLKLSKFKQSMQVRVDSLSLLFSITKYPAFALIPHKMDVILELQRIDGPLDDPKRLVRNAAVQASNAWHLVGAPNSSEN